MKTLDVSLRNKPESILRCLQRQSPQLTEALQRIIGEAQLDTACTAQNNTEETRTAAAGGNVTGLRQSSDVDVWTLPLYDDGGAPGATQRLSTDSTAEGVRVWRHTHTATTDSTAMTDALSSARGAVKNQTRCVVELTSDRYGRHTQEKHHLLSQLVYTYEVAVDLCDLHVRDVRRSPVAIEVHLHAAVVFAWLDIRKACRHLSSMSILSPLCAGGDSRFWALWARFEYQLGVEENSNSAGLPPATLRRMLKTATAKSVKRLKYGRNAQAKPPSLIDVAEKAILTSAAACHQPDSKPTPVTETVISTPIAGAVQQLSAVSVPAVYEEDKHTIPRSSPLKKRKLDNIVGMMDTDEHRSDYNIVPLDCNYSEAGVTDKDTPLVVTGITGDTNNTWTDTAVLENGDMSNAPCLVSAANSVRVPETVHVVHTEDVQINHTEDTYAVNIQDVHAVQTEDVQAVHAEDVHAVQTEDVQAVHTEDVQAVHTEDVQAVQTEDVQAVHTAIVQGMPACVAENNAVTSADGEGELHRTNAQRSGGDGGSTSVGYMTVNGVGYSVAGCIGRGGTSTVYEVVTGSTHSGTAGGPTSVAAVHIDDINDSTAVQPLVHRRKFALKVISLDPSKLYSNGSPCSGSGGQQANEGDAGAWFDMCRKEVDILTSLGGYPHIVQLYDYEIDEEQQRILLLMELGCQSLDSFVKTTLDPQPLSGTKLNTVVHIFRQLTRGVAAVHSQGIVHGDLKLANFIFVNPYLPADTLEGEHGCRGMNDDVDDSRSTVNDCKAVPDERPPPGILKLIDFGIAKKLNSNTSRTAKLKSEMMVTLLYMPPEMAIKTSGNMAVPVPHATTPACAVNQQPFDGSVDVWALGVILCRMLFGQFPCGLVGSAAALDTAVAPVASAGDVRGSRRPLHMVDVLSFLAMPNSCDILSSRLHCLVESEITTPDSETHASLTGLVDLICACLSCRPDNRPPIAAVVHHTALQLPLDTVLFEEAFRTGTEKTAAKFMQAFSAGLPQHSPKVAVEAFAEEIVRIAQLAIRMPSARVLAPQRTVRCEVLPSRADLCRSAPVMSFEMPGEFVEAVLSTQTELVNINWENIALAGSSAGPAMGQVDNDSLGEIAVVEEGCIDKTLASVNGGDAACSATGSEMAVEVAGAAADDYEVCATPVAPLKEDEPHDDVLEGEAEYGSWDGNTVHGTGAMRVDAGPQGSRYSTANDYAALNDSEVRSREGSADGESDASSIFSVKQHGGCDVSDDGSCELSSGEGGSGDEDMSSLLSQLRRTREKAAAGSMSPFLFLRKSVAGRDDDDCFEANNENEFPTIHEA